MPCLRSVCRIVVSLSGACVGTSSRLFVQHPGQSTDNAPLTPSAGEAKGCAKSDAKASFHGHI